MSNKRGASCETNIYAAPIHYCLIQVRSILSEETIDVKTFLSKKGYCPSSYKALRFYDIDSVVFITSEPFSVENEAGFLYPDPNKMATREGRQMGQEQAIWSKVIPSPLH
ncbi:hypothetical protein [Sphingobacterium sp. HMA12]|uniref:hypothetical protein n=1 Tax=Sphingobacterium sp. HMA12 TaxID=2050894 RepID=UPI000CEA520B|nr:hypothetical protein [Sphingobacterium sp. HMA12]